VVLVTIATLLAADLAGQQRAVVEHAGADRDRVAALAQFDVEIDVCLFDSSMPPFARRGAPCSSASSWSKIV
jgi:hypothetical protein